MTITSTCEVQYGHTVVRRQAASTCVLLSRLVASSYRSAQHRATRTCYVLRRYQRSEVHLFVVFAIFGMSYLLSTAVCVPLAEHAAAGAKTRSPA